MGTSERGEPYLVMEYLEGESLADMLSRTGPLTLPATCALLEPVLGALGAAHERGIVHRDLKPDNIFLAWIPGEAQPVIKLIDFGVSKLSMTGSTKMTITGTQFGTPTYMAPEQIRGDVTLDRRADLYSVGVVMYKMLTGKLPFTGHNNIAVFAKALTDPPMPLEEAFREAPVAASAMVMRLLEKDANARYASTSEVIEEMKSFPGYGERYEVLSQYTDSVPEKTFAGGDLGERSPERIGEAAPSAPPSNPQLRTTPTGWAKNTKPASSKKSYGLFIAIGAVVLLSVGVSLGIFLRSPSTPDGVEPAASLEQSPSTPEVKKSEAEADDSPPAPAEKAAEIVKEESPATPPAEIPPAVKAEIPPTIPEEKPPTIETVQLRVHGLPKGAAISFKDKRYDTPSFSVEKSFRSATLKVTANGYEDFTVDVTPDQDLSLEAHLKAIAPPVETRKEQPSAQPKKEQLKASSSEKKAGSSPKSNPRKSKVPEGFTSVW